MSNPLSTYDHLWGEAVADKGFAAIPNCFFFCKDSLGLSDQDLIVLCYLITRQFGARKPYMSASTVSEHLGKSIGARRASFRSLEKTGFIVRIHREHQSNEYDLRPGIHRLLNHECNNPVSKRSYTYRKIARAMYQKTDTKEEDLRKKSKKTNTQSVGDILTRGKHA